MSVFSAVPYFFRLPFLFSPTLPSEFSTDFFQIFLYKPDKDIEDQAHNKRDSRIE